MNVAGYFAHDDHFLGTDIGDDDSVAPNGHAAVSKIDGALDAAVDIKRFGAANFTLDYQRAPNRGLLHRGTYIFWWYKGVRVRRKFSCVGWVLCGLQHRVRPSLVPCGLSSCAAACGACEIVAMGQT